MHAEIPDSLPAIEIGGEASDDAVPEGIIGGGVTFSPASRSTGVGAKAPATEPGSGLSGERTRGIVAALGPAAMVAAPLALLAAMVSHPAHGMDGGSWLAAAEAGPGRFYAAHLLMLVAVALFAPATLALADLVRPRRATATMLGSVLALLGLLAVAVLIGMDFVAWQVARSAIAHGEALVLLQGAVTSPGVVAPLAVLLPGLVAGPGLLALVLYQERIVPAWRAALIPLGLVAVFAGLPLPLVAVAGAASLVVALGGFGLTLLSGGADQVGASAARLRRPRWAARTAAAGTDSRQR